MLILWLNTCSTVLLGLGQRFPNCGLQPTGGSWPDVQWVTTGCSLSCHKAFLGASRGNFQIMLDQQPSLLASTDLRMSYGSNFQSVPPTSSGLLLQVFWRPMEWVAGPAQLRRGVQKLPVKAPRAPEDCVEQQGAFGCDSPENVRIDCGTRKFGNCCIRSFKAYLNSVRTIQIEATVTCWSIV